MRAPSVTRLAEVAIVLIAVAAAGAVAVVNDAQENPSWLSWLTNLDAGGCPVGPVGPNEPLPAWLALDRPTEQQNSLNHWYNFTVESAGGGLQWRAFNLQVLTSTGTLIDTTKGWSAEAVDLNLSPIGSFEFMNGTGTTNSSAPLASSDTLVLDSGTTSLGGAGDTLNVLVVALCLGGSISVSIP